MYNFNTNAISVLGKEMMKLQALELATPNLLTGSATLTRELVADRIQKSGLNSAGQRMETRSRSKDGVYSIRHGKARRQRGLQVNSRVDFSFTGSLFSSAGWSVMRPAKVGFASDEETRKAGELEDYFGEAFNLSDTEYDLMTNRFFLEATAYTR